MARASVQRVLLIGDVDRQVADAVTLAAPAVTTKSVPTVFDGIAELSREQFGTVLLAASPVSRRPESALRAIRASAGTGRVLLFGDPSTEPLSRRMLQFGCDDYLITPLSQAQIKQALGPSPLKLRTDAQASAPPPAVPRRPEPVEIPPEPDLDVELAAPAQVREFEITDEAPGATALQSFPQMLLEALHDYPGDAIGQAIRQLSPQLGAEFSLSYVPASTPLTGGRGDRTRLQFPLNQLDTVVRLELPATQEPAGRRILAELAPLLGKAAAIQHRHNRLQKLAFTDDLTGLYNCRYFKHFLGKTLLEGRKHRFPVTLFLFDIDNFKSYNDRFGHGVGDEILRQTADLMRRCVRDHDLVARISGDEFAVVFWEKQGPRLPREPNGGLPGRPPSEPTQILQRFRRLLEKQTSYPELGPAGRGTLSISGGLAVYPYDAQDVAGLIEAADKALMFGAKRSGRNSIALVGGDATQSPLPPRPE